ncbi:MAG: DMT family transporter [Actinomycetota bacterium]
MSILFALLAALGWGSSDFAAGHASRRSSAVSVVVLTHTASFIALVAISLVPGQAGAPGVPDLLWGLAAGLAGGAGAMLLFRGLGRGSMSVVAPVTATGAALVPVFAGLVQGETIGSLGLLGVLLAICAIVLVSLAGADTDDDPSDGHGGPVTESGLSVAAGPAMHAAAGRDLLPSGPGNIEADGHGVVGVIEAPVVAVAHVTVAPVAAATIEPPRRRRLVDVFRQPGMTDALFSGVGFGLFFVLIAQTTEAAGHWPLVAARFVSAAMFAAIAIVAFTPVFPEQRSQPAVIVAGLLDAAAAVFFVLSTRSGLLSVGAVLASLYPAATVLLARFVTGERITRLQLAGLALAGGAVSLLAI